MTSWSGEHLDEPETRFTAELTESSDSEYTEATLRGKHELASDEPEWLPSGAGNDDHPAPVDYLPMSLAACQVSVLRQCLDRTGVDRFHVECETTIDSWGSGSTPEEMPPNTALRIDHVTVRMSLVTTPEFEDAADRCLVVYDDGCIVGRSLDGGLDYTPLTSLEVVDEL